MGMTAMLVAGFALSAAGAMSQRSSARAAAKAQVNFAGQERDAAIESAQETRESSVAAIHETQVDVILEGKRVKSDAARRADAERSTLLAIAGERGQLGTTSYMRQQLALNYFHEVGQGRVDRQMHEQVDSLQRDKQQVVSDQKRVIDNASLSYYGASVDAKLAKAAADRKAFFQIAQAGVEAGKSYFSAQATQSIATNNTGSVN